MQKVLSAPQLSLQPGLSKTSAKPTRTTPDNTSWEAVAAAIQSPDVSSKDVIALVKRFYEAVGDASGRHDALELDAASNDVGNDIFGCADTEKWLELVRQEAIYVKLSAQRVRLQPRVEQLQAVSFPASTVRFPPVPHHPYTNIHTCAEVGLDQQEHFQHLV